MTNSAAEIAPTSPAKKHIRSGFGSIAGLSYTLGNALFTFKDPIQTALSENRLDLTSLTQDPVATIGSGLLFASSLVMMFQGKTKKGMATSTGLAVLGFGVLFANGGSVGKMLSYSMGFVANAFGAYQNVKKEAVEKADDGAKKTNLAAFMENYPMVVTGGWNLATHGIFFAEALRDDDPMLKAVGALWLGGSTLLTLSKPEKKTPKPN